MIIGIMIQAFKSRGISPSLTGLVGSVYGATQIFSGPIIVRERNHCINANGGILNKRFIDLSRNELFMRILANLREFTRNYSK